MLKLKEQDCKNRHCEKCQCFKSFQVICKGHHYDTCNRLTTVTKNENKKKEGKIEFQYSTKYLRSLISSRVWLIAPDIKLTYRTIDLRKLKLFKAPDNLSLVEPIEAVRLDNNILFDDVDILKDMENLRVAVMKNCNISNLSDFGFSNTGLLALDLHGNKEIRSLSGLKNFPQLHHLNIGLCNLFRIPDELSMLQRLRVLVLNDNYLQKTMIDLSSLQKLQILLLNNCGLTEIPQTVLELRELQYLSIESNKIPAVPSAVTTLSKLVVISVYGNYKIQISTKLTRCIQLKRINVDLSFSLNSVSTNLKKLIKIWKDAPCAWWKQL